MIDREELTLLINNKLSMQKIAKRCSITVSEVVNLMKEYDLVTKVTGISRTRLDIIRDKPLIITKDLPVRLPDKAVKEKREKRLALVQELRKQNIAIVKQEHGNKCNICGYSKCSQALEFHHLDKSTKLYEISKLVDLESMKIEASKCILICSNCHREIHHCS